VLILQLSTRGGIDRLTGTKATPNFGNPAAAVRFTPYHSHLLHDSERAVIYFPHEMQDELERMFLLMAVLQTEIHRQDVRASYLAIIFRHHADWL